MKYVDDGKLIELGFATYEEYLSSEHWLTLRSRLAPPSSRCFVCRGSRVQLHHVTYERLGCERDDDLVPLCDGCHRRAHRLVEGSRKVTLSNAHVELRRRRRRGDVERRDTSTVGALQPKEKRAKAREDALRREAKARRKRRLT